MDGSHEQGSPGSLPKILSFSRNASPKKPPRGMASDVSLQLDIEHVGRIATSPCFCFDSFTCQRQGKRRRWVPVWFGC